MIDKRVNLKLHSYWEALALFLVFFLVSTVVQAQQANRQETPEVKEYVDVVNVEMLVRAMRKGKPVAGLKQTDFRLYENGKILPITSFTEVRRKIGTRENLELEVQEVKGKPKTERFFILYFWITDKTVNYNEPLDYFFSRVYKEGDLVLLVAQNGAFKISSREQIDKGRKWLDQAVSKMAYQVRASFKSLERALDQTFENYLTLLQQTEVRQDEIDQAVRSIVQTFDAFWKSYRYQYLDGNLKQLTALADSLKTIPLQKWGLVFFQENRVPFFDLLQVESKTTMAGGFSSARLIKELRKIRRTIKLPIAARRHINKVQQAFIRANATFHMMIPDTKNNDREYNELVTLENSYSQWQESFKKISRGTGGDIITGNTLKTSLRSLVDREDVYYRLTYSPRNIKKNKRKVKIKTRAKKVKLFHMTRVNIVKPKNIQLADVSVKDSILSLTLKHYLVVGLGVERVGDIQLVISAVNKQGETMKFSKNLALKGDESTISMKLKMPANGTYRMLITAKDNLSALITEHAFSFNHGS